MESWTKVLKYVYFRVREVAQVERLVAYFAALLFNDCGRLTSTRRSTSEALSNRLAICIGVIVSTAPISAIF